MAVKWCSARIADRTVWAEGLFTLKIAAEGVLPFEPGQFLQLAMDINDQRIYRPYSVASPFDSQLEFYIVMVEDGQLTPHLWRAPIGAEVHLSQRAAGAFTLSKAPDAENLWLISTGTGLAPYIAMLRTPIPWQRYQRIIVVHGVRHHSDLGYQEELGSYAQQHSGKFVYIPAMTRDSCGSILHGRIPSLLQSGDLERVAQQEIRADNAAVMLCGNPAMLDDVESTLIERGLKRHRSKSPGNIVAERYW